MASFTLTLSPAWGGTAFGPFDQGAVQLGSDGASCQITLGAELGVHPLHAVLWRGDDGSFGLQPGTHGAAIYLFQRGSPVATPVRGPVQALVGDAFALVTPEGPRFVLGDLAAGITASAQPAYRPPNPALGRLPTASAMDREVRRQVASKLGAGPLASVNTLVHKLRSGQLMQPRYILGAVAAVLLGGAALIGRFFG